MKKITSILFICFIATTNYAQLVITNGKHILEISSNFSGFYNYRSLKEGENDYSKNRFKLRDAQLGIDGRVGNKFEYSLKVDFADMAANSINTVIDPENPGLLNANITYKGFKFFDIEMGYGKIYYSRNTLVPFENSAYWQGAEITRGSIFSVRDVGVTLKKNFWKQRANLYLGAYTGLGELSLAGDNDPSGKLEYVGRFDISYPSRFRYSEVDLRKSPIPMFSIGIAGRYADKKLPTGTAFPVNATSSYGIKVIDGKRYVYGFDVAFQYQGFSGQFEIHQIKAQPQDPNDPLYQNYTPNQTKGYFLAGGYIAQLNYYIKNWRTILSARYEELDLNDLVIGKSKRFSPAVAMKLKGSSAMVKFQYFNILKEENIDPFSWKEQFRLGIQFQLK
ncbi:porin [Flavobacterium sp. SUN052]|uniref:porin n=1 Tax=Flavobacterium sp. SUN052 TaxID=3002441 RepID=UPI00237E1540|nr:porin [Flavobacterium sp. SUN052]MEC4004802.1 porin [Flavobacterium sp. SUN052]